VRSGVPGELYYVREGQVNDYALGFTLPLHTNVTRLFFDWFDDSFANDPPVKLQNLVVRRIAIDAFYCSLRYDLVNISNILSLNFSIGKWIKIINLSIIFSVLKLID